MCFRQMLFKTPSMDTEYLLTGKQFIKLSKKQSRYNKIIAVVLCHKINKERKKEMKISSCSSH